MHLPLIREDGSIFSESDVEETTRAISKADQAERVELRNSNAAALARHEASHLLIAAGPGTGKSYLFLARIDIWARRFPGTPIYVSTFTRKLALDLANRVQSSDLPDGVKARVTVSTLHTLARSILEQNGGTSTTPMAPFIRIITEEWKPVVWSDVLYLTPPDISGDLRHLEARFHESEHRTDDGPWLTLHPMYERLCQFYNAVGFADSITLATEALQQNPSLRTHGLWIFDEFQDFNVSEEKLVATCVAGADAIVLAGDDDQAIYQTFKGSRPEILRRWYRDPGIANAMLPLCDRLSHHICMGASRFLERHGGTERIRKVFLPIDTDSTSTRIQVVYATSPRTAVDYATDFIADHVDEISARADAIREGTSDEPFLLILSPDGDLSGYLDGPGAALAADVDALRLADAEPGDDYLHVRLYHTHHLHPRENFPLRKVLHLEGVNPEIAASLVGTALAEGLTLSEVAHEAIAAVRAKCRRVHDVLEDGSLTHDEAADAIGRLIRVADTRRLAADLAAFPISSALAEDDSKVETARYVSPVEVMTMFGAKGLTADHVILIGADATNMAYTSHDLFYVALTRARRSLHVLVPLRARGADRAHQFVLDLPEQHCDYWKRLASGPTQLSRAQFVAGLDAYRTRLRR
ncbi:MAG: UvrD-helicase domain-containing protein [Acidimicrobiia bacterium]